MPRVQKFSLSPSPFLTAGDRKRILLLLFASGGSSLLCNRERDPLERNTQLRAFDAFPDASASSSSSSDAARLSFA